MMAESEIYIHKRNIRNITERLQKLEIENLQNEERISQVKTENKTLYSTEYELIHKILHYEKKLSEMTNMKQKNLNILNQAKIDFERVEHDFNSFNEIRDRIINTINRKKENIQREMSRLCIRDNVNHSPISTLPALPDLNPELLESLKSTMLQLSKNLSSILYEKNNQLSINFEKKSEYVDKLRYEISDMNIKIEELEYPEELMNKLYGIISAINTKNNYYELVERDENLKKISEDKYKARELKRAINEKLMSNRINKIKRM